MKFATVTSKVAIAGLAAAGTLALQQPMQAASYTIDDFTGFESGQSIEGFGTVHELLNIDAIEGEAVAIFEGTRKNNSEWSYQSNSGTRINGGLNLGGFSETSTNKNARNNSFRFTFADGYTASDFSLLMLDYGDYNAFGAKEHNVYLTAYSGDQQVSQDSLSGRSKQSGGDATSPDGGTPFGRTTLFVQGEGITSVELTFDFIKGNQSYDKSFDPFIGFDQVSFTAQASDMAGVPEPASTLALVAVGLVGATSLMRKQQA